MPRRCGLLIKQIRGLQVCKERRFEAADSESSAVGVGVDPVLVIFVAKAHDRIPHTKFEDVEASFDFFLLESWKLSCEVPDRGFYRIESALRIHILNVQTHDCALIPYEIHTLKSLFEI